jgi:hypothetical protein
MVAIGIMNYQQMGMSFYHLSNFIFDYQCGNCGMKYINSDKCNNCNNTTHFHKINCFSHLFRKIFKCKLCIFKTCTKCNKNHNQTDKMCHECTICHEKNKIFKFCHICNKCVNPFIHKPNDKLCKSLNVKKQI